MSDVLKEQSPGTGFTVEQEALVLIDQLGHFSDLRGRAAVVIGILLEDARTRGEA